MLNIVTSPTVGKKVRNLHRAFIVDEPVPNWLVYLANKNC